MLLGSRGQRRVLAYGAGAGHDPVAADDDAVGWRPGDRVAGVRGADSDEDRW
jgi:hypothetical protein